jgi:hypothetical protein
MKVQHCENCGSNKKPESTGTEGRVIYLEEQLKRWEQYRTEMENFEQQMVKCAEGFMELKAYSDAAECLSKAGAARFICGRMPFRQAE